MKIAALARWSARLAATAVTGLFITFLVGEGTPDPRALTDQEIAMFGALLVMIIGTLIAWRRDFTGALILLAGFAGFAWLEQGWPPAAFLVYPAAAALLLLSGLLRFIHLRRHPADAPTASSPPPTPRPAA